MRSTVIDEMSGSEAPFLLMLAPMAGVTDLPFRRLARMCGADVTVTEFTSSAALSRDVARSWAKMATHPDEVPFIPQIFGGDLNEMVATVRALAPRADLIDLNFGCPAPKVARICAGAALMGEPDLLVAIVRACVDASDVPITAKLRTGVRQDARNIVELSQRLEDAGVVRLCVHGRTLAQRYRGEADWSLIKDVVQAVTIPVIANGDVVDAATAIACLDATGAAGLMVGRGAIGRPMIFAEIKQGLGLMSPEEVPWHNDLPGLEELSPQTRAFRIRRWCWEQYMRLARESGGLEASHVVRHAVAFTKGLPGAKSVRSDLHRMSTAHDLATSVLGFLSEATSE